MADKLRTARQVAQERMAQGLPATVEDPGALRKIAALLENRVDVKVAAPRKATTKETDVGTNNNDAPIV